MLRNCIVDPLYVINMCCYEKASECLYIAIFDEAEIGLLVVGLAYTKNALVDKGTLGSW